MSRIKVDLSFIRRAFLFLFASKPALASAYGVAVKDAVGGFYGGSFGGSGTCSYQGESGSNGCAAEIIVSDLESQTRKIMRQMDGLQPTDHDWDTFFGRNCDSMASKTRDKMMAAHNVAKAQAEDQR